MVAGFSSNDTLPAANDFTSDSDQLFSLVLITFCVFAVPSSTPASPRTDCASGNAVSRSKFSVTGCDG